MMAEKPMLAAVLATPQASHILILMHDFSTGGTERIAIRMAERWALAGRRVTILCGTEEGAVRSLVSPLIEVVGVFPEIRRSALSRWKLARAFAPMISALKPDLIFAPGNFHLSVAGLLARHLGRSRPPIICKLSNPLTRPPRTRWQQAIFTAFVRRFAHPIDAFSAMSDALRDEASAVIDGQKIRVISEPVLEDHEAPAGSQSASPLILCIGRLVQQKNFLRAIQAFAHLAPHSDARMMILGEGEQRALLEREIQRLGLGGRIKLAGHVINVRPALAQCRFLLISSDFEGYPAVAVEALAARRPVVTTYCTPAIKEMLPHPSFGRITSSDPAEMGEALLAMVDATPPDEAALKSLLDRHRCGPVSDSYLALFDDAVFRRAIDCARARTIDPRTCDDEGLGNHLPLKGPRSSQAH